MTTWYFANFTHRFAYILHTNNIFPICVRGGPDKREHNLCSSILVQLNDSELDLLSGNRISSEYYTNGPSSVCCGGCCCWILMRLRTDQLTVAMDISYIIDI